MVETNEVDIFIIHNDNKKGKDDSVKSHLMANFTLKNKTVTESFRILTKTHQWIEMQRSSELTRL